MMRSIKDVGYMVIEESRDEYGNVIAADFSSDKEIGDIVKIDDFILMDILTFPNVERIDNTTIRLGSYLLEKVDSKPHAAITYYKVLNNGKN